MDAGPAPAAAVAIDSSINYDETLDHITGASIVRGRAHAVSAESGDR